MSCDCYKIGGPFIGADPECPAHGVDGYEKRFEKLESALTTLTAENARLREVIRDMRRYLPTRGEG